MRDCRGCGTAQLHRQAMCANGELRNCVSLMVPDGEKREYRNITIIVATLTTCHEADICWPRKHALS
jgi:hypothetical protein